MEHLHKFPVCRQNIGARLQQYAGSPEYGDAALPYVEVIKMDGSGVQTNGNDVSPCAEMVLPYAEVIKMDGSCAQMDGNDVSPCADATKMDGSCVQSYAETMSEYDDVILPSADATLLSADIAFPYGFEIVFQTVYTIRMNFAIVLCKLVKYLRIIKIFIMAHKHIYDAEGHEEHDHGHDHSNNSDSAFKTFMPAAISLVLLLTGIALDHWSPQTWFTDW